MGKMIQFDKHIFQLGWNHQRVTYTWMVDSYGFHVGIYTEPEEKQFIYERGSNIWKPNIVIGRIGQSTRSQKLCGCKLSSLKVSPDVLSMEYMPMF